MKPQNKINVLSISLLHNVDSLISNYNAYDFDDAFYAYYFMYNIE